MNKIIGFLLFIWLILVINYVKLRDFSRTFLASIQLNICKFKAKMYHESDGKKYYVIRTDHNRYVVWNNNDIKAYVMTFKKSERSYNYLKLIQNACYITNNNNLKSHEKQKH